MNSKSRAEIILVILGCLLYFYFSIANNIYFSIYPYILLENQTNQYSNSTNDDKYIKNLISSLVTVRSICRMIFSTIAGTLIDRYGPFKILNCTFFIHLLEGVIGFFAKHRIDLMYITRIIDGCMAPIFSISVKKLLWTHFDNVNLRIILSGLTHVWFIIGYTAAPYFGAFMYQFFGYNGIPLIVLITLVVCFLFFIMQHILFKGTIQNNIDNSNNETLLNNETKEVKQKIDIYFFAIFTNY